MPLYMSAILDMLRKKQKADRSFSSFLEFENAVSQLRLSPAQKVTLQQRLNLLSSFIAEPREDVVLERCDIIDCGSAVAVVDLTDPMISEQEANGIFKVRARKDVKYYQQILKSFPLGRPLSFSF